MRLPLPPFLAAHPLRQHWIWRGPSCGEVRRRAEPPPLRGRVRPSILTGPSSARPPRGRPAGSIPSPPFPASPGPPPGPVKQAGLPPPHTGCGSPGSSPGRGFSGAIATPRSRGELGAMPPGPSEAPAGLRGPKPPGQSRPAASARTRAGAALPDLEQQDDDGRQVGQVPGEAEDVHGGGGRGGGAAGAGERRWRKLSGHRATWPGDVARQPRAGARREAGGAPAPPRAALTAGPPRQPRAGRAEGAAVGLSPWGGRAADLHIYI